MLPESISRKAAAFSAPRFPLLVFLAIMPYSMGGTDVLISGSCKKLFGGHASVDENPATWTVHNDNVFCSVCGGKNTKKSWFYTEWVRTRPDQLIHIDIKVKFNHCDDFPDQAIGVFITDKKRLKEEERSEIVKKLDNSTHIKSIKNERNCTSHTVHIEYKSPFEGIALVFLAEGGCALVHNIKLWAFVCEAGVVQGVNLTKTYSPPVSIRVNASCVPNTRAPSTKPVFGLCSSNGTWRVPWPCLCKEGFLLESNGCTACSGNSFKTSFGNHPCIPCPMNSESAESKVTCQCKEGFHRFVGDNATQPCHGIPSEVKDIRFPHRTDSSITVAWKPPAQRRAVNGVIHYDIKCFVCKSSDDCKGECGAQTLFRPGQYNISVSKVIVEKLKADTEYKFVIYSKNSNSFRVDKEKWKKAEKTTKTEGSSTSVPISSAVRIGVPIVVVTLVIIIVALVIVIFKWRKVKRIRRASTRRKSKQVEFPLLGEKNYIDPTTYDDPERAVNEFAKELDRDQITFESVLGGGEFGDVYKGTLKRLGEPSTKVAIKTLKAGSTTKNRKDFLLEASVMGQFKNLNVISLEGVVTQSIPLLIVTEYMENGSLDEYLKNNDGLLKPLQLLGMARGVASGMAYLAGMHFVHRDLAARNVLVNVNLTCKVADFGLSRDIGECKDSEYETQGGRIPVRWTAPEAIRYRKFSTASDVWSYGILLWEIMSFAERPYWDWGNLEVLERVDQGYRLPPPMNCPKTVHQLMMECWESDRTKRPAFADIVKLLDEWLHLPEKLNEDKIKLHRSEPLDFSTFTSVKDWLDAFKMGMYASNFAKAGYRELSDVVRLTEDDLLSKVGVRLVGHRNKIYQQINEMNQHMRISRDNSVRI